MKILRHGLPVLAVKMYDSMNFNGINKGFINPKSSFRRNDIILQWLRIE